MEQTNKLNWIKKVTPLLYSLSLAGICLYIALRCRSWANLLLPWETGFVFFPLAAVYYLSNQLLCKKYLVAENRALTYWVSVATFVVIYLSMSILCADLLQWLLHFFLTDAARQTLFILCGFACLAFTLFFACYGYYKTTKIVTVQYPLASEKLARPLRIVQLSDLHIGFFVGEQHIRKTVEAVNRLQPDMVVISGDMINAANTLECPEIEAVERLLAQLHSVKGTYAVVGNHDPEVSDPVAMCFPATGWKRNTGKSRWGIFTKLPTL